MDSSFNFTSRDSVLTPLNPEVVRAAHLKDPFYGTPPRQPPARRPHHGVLAEDGALMTAFICWVEPVLVLAGIFANVCIIVGMLHLRDGSGVGR